VRLVIARARGRTAGPAGLPYDLWLDVELTTDAQLLN